MPTLRRLEGCSHLLSLYKHKERACQKRQAGGWATRLPKKASGWLGHVLAKKGRRGGWTRSWSNSPRPLLSLALFHWRREREREREREPGIRNFFFVNTSPCARSSAKVSHQVVISSIGSHVLLVSPCNSPITEHISRFV